MLWQALLTHASSAPPLSPAISPFSTHRAFLRHLETVTVMQVLCHRHGSDFPADDVCFPGREGVCSSTGSVWVCSAVFLPSYQDTQADLAHHQHLFKHLLSSRGTAIRGALAWSKTRQRDLKDEGTKTDPDQELVQLVFLPDVPPGHPCPFCHFSSHPALQPFVILISQVCRSLLLSTLPTTAFPEIKQE